jgi:N-acetylneuraminate synthase
MKAENFPSVFDRSKGCGHHPMPYTGFSDHTIGTYWTREAIKRGATIIEKHFTLNRADGGVDSTFSMEPVEMAQFVVEANRAWEALGEVKFGPLEEERNSIQFRRSLYVVADVEPGEYFSQNNLRAIRPVFGLPPKYLGDIIGRVSKRFIKRGTAVTWDLLI